MRKILRCVLILGLVLGLVGCNSLGVETSIEGGPTPPEKVSTAAVKGGIKLTWEEQGAKYIVYRGTDKDFMQPLFNVPITKSNYRDQAVKPNTTYYYAVQTIDQNNVNSDLSKVVKQKTKSAEGVVVHYKDQAGTPNIYTWYYDDSGTKHEPSGSWNGSAMNSEGSDWYQAEFSGVEKINLKFISASGETTDDLSRSAGEWWYKNGQWYNLDPEQLPSISIQPDFQDPTNIKQCKISVTGKNILSTRCQINDELIKLTEATTIDLTKYSSQEQISIQAEAVNKAGAQEKEVNFNDFIIHYRPSEGQQKPKAYVWYDYKNKERRPLGGWPGTELKSGADNWYQVTFNNLPVDKLNIIFNWHSADEQTANLSRSPGEWWAYYQDGSLIWSDHRPDK